MISRVHDCLQKQRMNYLGQNTIESNLNISTLMLPRNTNKRHVLTLPRMRKRILYRNYRQYKNGKKIARQTILNVA